MKNRNAGCKQGLDGRSATPVGGSAMRAGKSRATKTVARKSALQKYSLAHKVLCVFLSVTLLTSCMPTYAWAESPFDGLASFASYLFGMSDNASNTNEGGGHNR